MTGEPWNADWRRIRARRWETAAAAPHPLLYVVLAWWLEAVLTPRPKWARPLDRLKEWAR